MQLQEETTPRGMVVREKALRSAVLAALSDELGELRKLRTEQEVLKVEVEVLRNCLNSRGFLRETDLHRERFERVRLSSGWEPDDPQARHDAFHAASVTKRVTQCTGGGAIPRLRAVCRTLRHSCDAVREQRLYLVGGAAEGSGADPSYVGGICLDAGGSWEALPSQQMRLAQCHHAGAVLGSCLYICGGPTLGRSVLRLDTGSQVLAWSAVRPMSEARCFARAVGVGKWLYVCGGTRGVHVLGSMERFDPTAGPEGAWGALPQMAQPRTRFAACALRGQLFLCGGSKAPPSEESPTAILSSSQSYNPISHTWHDMPPMPRPCFEHTAAELRGVAFVCGGLGGGGASSLSRMACLQIFNPASGWSQGPTMLRPRCGHATVAFSDRLYICGGFESSENVCSMEQLDWGSGVWEETAPHLHGRVSFCALALVQHGSQVPREKPPPVALGQRVHEKTVVAH